MAQGWDPIAGLMPRPPMNGQAMSTFTIGVIDIRWDDPRLLASNSNAIVVGVNVYRSETSDRGPYYRLNDFPVGGNFWRDCTQNVPTREIVDWNTSWQHRGDKANTRQWTFRTKNPIVKKISHAPYQTPTFANSVHDVTVFIDGVEVPVNEVFGPTGEVTLINQPAWNQATENFDAAAIPTVDSVVEIVYYVNRNFVSSAFGKDLHYRLATVVVDSSTPSGYRETELSYCEPITPMAVETLDYIWREAIRRNHWILQQGGERVKVFIRKMSGVPCTCKLDPKLLEYSQQPSQRCTTCYGVGFVGGYEGGYDSIIAPDDADNRYSQQPTGRKQEHTYEVWTVPSPIITQRDFIVKQTNDRYAIGPVRRPSNRGNVLQQHFTISSMDDADIRYQVPIDGTADLKYPETRYSAPYRPPVPQDGDLPIAPPFASGPDPVASPYPEGVPDSQLPMITQKDGWSDQKQPRGRTPVWDNINKGISWLMIPLLWGLAHEVSQIV